MGEMLLNNLKQYYGMKHFFVIALALLLLSASVCADGMVVRPVNGEWHPYRESSQRAIINYENGYENLLLFVKTEGNPQTEKFVWIFPVPSKPEQIEITNLKGFPNFYGTEQKGQFKTNLMILAGSNFVAAFPPVALLALVFIVSSPIGGPAYDATIGIKGRGYDIWKHIDRFGIATEVVTAYDSERFYRFLAARGTNLSSDAKQRIDEYIGLDYSFIVSWISNPEEYRNQGSSTYYDEPIGVFVRFPTEQMYYPMKMTGIYQDSYVPTTIDIINYREPEIYQNISKETTVGYYFSDRLQYGLNEEKSIRTVFNGTIPQQLRFTRISINTQARYFVQDLWIANNASIAASALEVINALWLLLAIIIFFALSFASVFLVNKIILGNFLNRKRMALLAGSNFLTIFGFIVAVFLLRAKLSEKERNRFRFLRAMAGFWAIFFGIAILFLIIAILATVAIK